MRTSIKCVLRLIASEGIKIYHVACDRDILFIMVTEIILLMD